MVIFGDCDIGEQDEGRRGRHSMLTSARRRWRLGEDEVDLMPMRVWFGGGEVAVSQSRSTKLRTSQFRLSWTTMRLLAAQLDDGEVICWGLCSGKRRDG